MVVEHQHLIGIFTERDLLRLERTGQHGLGATHILNSRLDTPRDDLRRIKQSAIPIEGDQIKLPGLWRGAHRGTGGCTESINCCRAAGSGALTVTGRALTGC